MKIADNPYYYGLFADDEVKLENTAEALASFICEQGTCQDLWILTPESVQVINTSGIWIDKCCDQEFLQELKEVLIPKQKLFMESQGFPELPG